MSLLKRNKFNTQKSSVIAGSEDNIQQNAKPQQGNSQQPNIRTSKDVSIETGFIQYYTDEQLINTLIKQQKAAKGKLNIAPTGYKTGYVETNIGKIRIPNRQALNRAFHGDIVVIIILGYEEKLDQIMKWNIEGNSKRKGKQNNEANDDLEGQLDVQQYEMLGYVIKIVQRAKIIVECLYDPNKVGPRSLFMNPINMRYPQIEVSNTFSKPPEQNQIFNIEITMWAISQLSPAGVVRGEGKKINTQNLDEIAEFTLAEYGIPYIYKRKLDELPGYQKHLAEIRDAENKFMQELQLEYDDIFTLKQETLDNVQNLINHIGSPEIQEMLFQNQRTDLSHKPVFTIDPTTAKDFDDAMHIDVVMYNGEIISPGEVVRRYYKRGEFDISNYDEDDLISLEEAEAFYEQINDFNAFQKKFLSFLNKNATEYEIGVHIADVTTFVQQNSKLDEVASELTTSIYLSDRCCPMYPFELADGLCSLNPCVPRYSFSVVFRLNKSAELTQQIVWFGHTLIISKARLDYVLAQEILQGNFQVNGTTINSTVVQEGNNKIPWPLAFGYRGDVICSIPIINELSKKLMKQRMDMGAMGIESCEPRWNIRLKDTKSYTVDIFKPEQAKDAHDLIAEFMILTNQLVAFRVAASFPICTVLRCHQTPKVQFPYSDLFKKQKFSVVNYSGAKQLTQSVKSLTKEVVKRLGNQLDMNIFTREEAAGVVVQNIAMSNGLTRAEYIAGISEKGQLVAHWGIHALLYTHFTSPIRRYSDDLIHRMLHVALQLENEAYGTYIKQKNTQRAQEIHKKPQNYYESNEFTYIPHRLAIEEITSIYSLTAALPNKKLAQLADQCNPLNQSTSKNKKSEKIYQTGRTLVEDIEQGKHGLNIRGNQKIKQQLHQQVQAIIQDMNNDRDESMEYAPEDPQYMEEKDSFAQKMYQKVLDMLKQNLHYTINDLRNFMEHCNMNKKSEEMCEEHHHMYMLVLYILQQGTSLKTQLNYTTNDTKSNTLDKALVLDKISILGPASLAWKAYVRCKATLITGEKSLIFTIINYNVSFQIKSQSKLKENGVFLVKINQNIPLNKQKPLRFEEDGDNEDDGEVFYKDDVPGVVIQEFTIMELFDVVIFTTGNILDQIDIYQIKQPTN